MADRSDIAKKRLRADFLTSFVIYLVCVLVILLLGFISYDTWLSNDQRNTILDCTQVGGKCFERSQRSMQEAVAAIVKDQEASSRATREVVIYASYCVKLSTNQTVSDVEQCVNNLLAASRNNK